MEFLPSEDYYKIISAIAEAINSVNKNAVYAEMGILVGKTFNVVAPYFQRAYAIDIDPSVYKFIFANQNLVWVNDTTQNFITSLNKDIKFDMVFIDADHRHDASLADFLGIAPFVNDNGLILLHDTYPINEIQTQDYRCSDSYKTAWYIRTKLNKEYEIVTIPYYYGLSIVRKANKQLLWI